MEETKIETLNEGTSDNIEEVKEAPKRRGRKPKSEFVEAAAAEKSTETKQSEPEVVESDAIEEVTEVEAPETAVESDNVAESRPIQEVETSEEANSNADTEAEIEKLEVSEDAGITSIFEEPHEFPKTVMLKRPIMFYASPTKVRASGLIRGNLIIKEELYNFVKVSVVIPELGRTTGYVLKSDLKARM